MDETTNGAVGATDETDETDETIRRWIGRSFAVFYVTTVTIAVGLLVLIGEGGLAAWLGAVEIASVITVGVVLRRPRARPVGPDGTPRRTTRLGTPLDPGMPSGRKEPPRRPPARPVPRSTPGSASPRSASPQPTTRQPAGGPATASRQAPSE